MLEREREQLIENLVHTGYIRSDAVVQAMRTVKRELFLPTRLRSQAYHDTPLEIGLGQTISAPHMVAIMCEALDIQKNQIILEIGAGSGYHAAVTAHIIGTTGHVYSVERFEQLAQQAQKNLKNAGVTNVTIIVGRTIKPGDL